MLETSPITKIKGIGPKSAEAYARAGIETVGDLIRYYPRTYDRFEDPVDASGLSAADDGATAAVEGYIEKQLSVRFLKAFRIVTGKIRTGGICLDVTWFNMPFMKNQVRPGISYIFRGQIKAKGKKFYLLQPKVYDLFDYARLQKSLQPVYPLTAGLTENSLRKALKNAFCGQDPLVFQPDILPESMRKKYGLPAMKETITTIHFPENEDALENARHRLVFEEFLTDRKSVV